MRYFLFILTFAITGCATKTETKDASTADSQNTVVLINPSDFDRQELVSLKHPGEDIPVKPGMGKIGPAPVEGVDTDNDGKADMLLAYAKIAAHDTLKLNLNEWEATPKFPKKTQAEISVKTGGKWEGREYKGGEAFKNIDFLRVPEQHTDHSYFIRYEGPGWENELIGYRAYLDWRNAIDIFGKKVDTLVLQQVGQDGFDSYHEESEWGMDILKAGQSLGIGSIGRLNAEDKVEHFEKTDSVTCEIVQDGHLSSAVETNYYGWTTGPGTSTIRSVFTINTGDRATRHDIYFNTAIDGFCTGIVKHPAGEFLEGGSGDWYYIATFGKQTLFDDKLGMAIIYKAKDAQQIKKDDEFSHLVVFNPTQELTYYFLGAWEKEPGGIASKEDFQAYLEKQVQSLNQPIEVQ